MAGWTRKGRKGSFRYFDGQGREIRDEAKLERVQKLAIPPAWKDVWISPSARAKLAEHLDNEGLDRERISAVALRLINSGWFRVGSERYARESGTYGITTLTKRHVTVRGNRITLAFRGKHSIQVRSTIADDELAVIVRELLKVPKGSRVFRYEWEGELYSLTSKRLNDYVKLYMGPDFSAKDFRTWGGTLVAATAFAERAQRHGFPETKTDEKRSISSVMQRVAQQLGNTPAVCRASYVSPAVIDQYLEGRTIEDFRPRHLRVVSARDVGLDAEEQALLSLLRSWRIRQAREAA
jgi:DNA topoisomerase-1